MTQESFCPICRSKASGVLDSTLWVVNHHCVRCGRFTEDRSGEISRRQFPPEGRLDIVQIAKLSGYVRENQGCEIWSAFKNLERLPMPMVMEKAAKLLRYISRVYPVPGSKISIDFSESGSEDPNLLSSAWAQNMSEVKFLVHDCLIALGYLKNSGTEGQHFTGKITGTGWDFLQRRPDLLGKTGFVAMWFHQGMEEVWKQGIEPGILSSGHLPIRIDKERHNNDITDEILAGIRQSKFILADFTGSRAGVYYEAGFAAGLGKVVVRTIERKRLHRLHFDTRQISHIPWERDKLDLFAKNIRDHIVATIGEGPVLSWKT